jgi:hypothetical protein
MYAPQISHLDLWLIRLPVVINHYYHFAAELLFGAWRMYASLDKEIDKYGNTVLPDPTRMIFVHCGHQEWRDRPSMNQYFTYAAFPSISEHWPVYDHNAGTLTLYILGIETSLEWRDRSELTSSREKQRVWRFPSVLLTDRSASFHGRFCGLQTQRTASEAFEATRNTSSNYWWEPIRRRVLAHAGVEQAVLDRAMSEERWKKDIVITYISRQGGPRRRLRDRDHKALVSALLELGSRKGWVVNIVMAESLSREEQLQIAARTTVS